MLPERRWADKDARFSTTGNGLLQRWVRGRREKDRKFMISKIRSLANRRHSIISFLFPATAW